MSHGTCHCGANRFKVDLPIPLEASVCDCKACSKNGFMWAFLPESSVVITKGGEASLTTCSTEMLSYQFCRICGTGLFGAHACKNVLERLSGVNVRTIHGLNPFQTHTIKDVRLRGDDLAGHNKNLKKDGDSDRMIYPGSCVCGAISLTLKSKPLIETEIKEDNCSICMRNAFVGIYPHESFVAITGKDQCVEYLFGNRFNGHPFCKVCGVQGFQNLHGPPAEVVAAASEARQKMIKQKLEIQPINVRILDGANLEGLRIHRSDEGTTGYTVEGDLL